MTNCNTPRCAMPCDMARRCTDADTSCSCTKGRFPVSTAYAMAYVPFQQSAEVYPCDRALVRGTLFPCLDLPFLRGCCK